MAEELQRASSAYARSLVEASLDPLVTISSEGKITDVNEASVQAPAVAARTSHWHRLLRLLHRAGEGAGGYQQVFSQGFVRDTRSRSATPRAASRTCSNNASVYKNDKGQVLGVFAAARDVTDRKLAEAKQRAAAAYARSLIEAVR